MRKHLAALLSIFGLAGSAVPGGAQVLKGSKPPVTNENSKTTQKVQPGGQNKGLKLKQQTVRKQENDATKGQTKAAAPAQKLTLKQENLRNATGKNAGQLTKGNQQITKGNQQITK
ncbi:MAG TPA: hypothetical protein VNW97_20240 [Candidatus Saccharimonadales bacterium]|jgi:hypothetical protein|nr:hypothetical protein [Candidatus Saccharimonadales bacterium]